jgi:hypothetical protein
VRRNRAATSCVVNIASDCAHSSTYFTADVYQHADEETVDRALAGLEEAFGG